jgi:signal peptidase I
MTPPIDDHRADNKPRRSPWLSIWFRPGNTIEHALSTKSWLSILILAALGGASGYIGAVSGYGLLTALMDWHNLAIVLLAGFIAGVAGLFFNAFFLKLSGMLLGGHASQAHIRAALAWSMVPIVFGLAIYLAAIIGLTLAGAVDSSQSAFRAVDLGLTAITIVLGLWTLVITVGTVKRVQRFGVGRAILNVAISWVLAGVALAVPIRTLLFQPFNIPSGAEKPTLLIGDYIFVSKYAYGYTRFSLPFSPSLFTGRIFPVEPQRGDVVVFRHPKDTATDYVKRIVGLPGDRTQMKDGVLIINGIPVKRERVEDFIDDESGQAIRRWRQTLPNGVNYFTLDLQDNSFLDNTEIYTVPAGHYFMLGDNLDNSVDSRIPVERRGLGYVPFENLIGRVEIIFFSINRANAAQPRIRYGRIGKAVR